MTTNWRRYLDDYHRKHPAITEEILNQSLDENGDNPYDWLLSTLPRSSEAFVDLACGSAPMATRLTDRGSYLGVDRSDAELRAARHSNPGATFLEADVQELPLERGVADTVVCSMALMLLQPLHTALREVSRILRPGGIVIATFPVNGPASVQQLQLLVPTFWRLRSLPAWPQRITKRSLDHAVKRLPLEVRKLDRRTFDWEISDPDTARRMIDGLYLPNASWAHKESAINYLVSQSRHKPTVPVHIGRVAMVRSGS